MTKPVATPNSESRFIRIGGQVQGVGFRPFVYRQAHRFALRGEVQNCSGTVEIRVQGNDAAIQGFIQSLVDEAPPLARPCILQSEPAETKPFTTFTIASSSQSDKPDIHIPPDYFTCEDCLQELTDPAQRRYHYPFINCTQCGPRYTIILSLIHI